MQVFKIKQDIFLQILRPSNHCEERNVTISVRKYPKISKDSNFQRHFLENGWSYSHEILHDN